MATNLGLPSPSLDYFSFPRNNPETKNIRPTSIWNLSPCSDTGCQSPPSDDSLTVSPVSPYTFPISGRGYTLQSDEADINQKVDPSLLCNSSFDDWMLWDSADNTLYPCIKSVPVSVKLEPASPGMEALELSGGLGISTVPQVMPNIIDDGSVAFQDSISDEPLFQAPQDIQSRPTGPLYTKSASWSQTRSAYQATPRIHPYAPLSTNEASELLSIAMPASPVPTSQSPSQCPDTRRKRKSSSSTASSSSSASSNPTSRRHPPIKKTAHNMIEKRYRTNLNDKIAALRDSVPSLRVVESKVSDGDAGVNEDLQGLEVAHKLNKATILSKATEYITHLENRNTHLSKECQSLKDRVEAFEILLMSKSGSNSQNSNFNFGPRHHSQGQGQKPKWKQQQ